MSDYHDTDFWVEEIKKQDCRVPTWHADNEFIFYIATINVYYQLDIYIGDLPGLISTCNHCIVVGGILLKRL